MKTLLTHILITIFGVLSLSADEGELNKALEERIKANQEFTEELVEYAKESKYQAELVLLENQSGDYWAAYLKYALQSKDLRLKAHVLRTEYTQEIIDGYYDLEFEENEEERALLKASIKDFKMKLAHLQKTVFKGEVEKTSEDIISTKDETAK